MRQYVIGSWNDADQYDYSGEQVGNRLGASREVSHFNKDGSANVAKYGDNTESVKRKSSIPLKDRILPQAARVERLTQQMKDLVEEYKQGVHTPEEYTLLLDILSVKRTRAIELLNRAKNVKPKRFDDEDTHVEAEQENVVLKGEKAIKQSQKKLESCVFLGACVLICILMLMMSH